MSLDEERALEADGRVARRGVRPTRRAIRPAAFTAVYQAPGARRPCSEERREQRSCDAGAGRPRCLAFSTCMLPLKRGLGG